jgi:hypothetical protein
MQTFNFKSRFQRVFPKLTCKSKDAHNINFGFKRSYACLITQRDLIRIINFQMSDYEDEMDVDMPVATNDIKFSSDNVNTKGKRSAANLPIEAEDSLPW